MYRTLPQAVIAFFQSNFTPSVSRVPTPSLLIRFVFTSSKCLKNLKLTNKNKNNCGKLNPKTSSSSSFIFWVLRMVLHEFFSYGTKEIETHIQKLRQSNRGKNVIMRKRITRYLPSGVLTARFQYLPVLRDFPWSYRIVWNVIEAYYCMKDVIQP